MSTEEIQAELPDTFVQVDNLRDHLSCAECSETRADLKANLAEALSEARALVAKLEELSRA